MKRQLLPVVGYTRQVRISDRFINQAINTSPLLHKQKEIPKKIFLFVGETFELRRVMPSTLVQILWSKFIFESAAKKRSIRLDFQHTSEKHSS